MNSIDLSKKVQFSNGVQLINCTPHTVTFLDHGEVVTVDPCGATLLAKAVETPAGVAGQAQLVTTKFHTSPQGLEELKFIEDTCPPETLVLGSIISAQAYKGRVVGMIPAPGFERAAPAEKRFQVGKFTTFA